MKRVCASVLAAALVCGAAEAEAQSPTGGGEAVSATPRDKCRLDEISPGVGYVFGNLRKNPVDLEMIPAFTRFGFSINGWLHLDSDVHTVQLAFEPFVIRVFEPAKVGAIGWDLFVRYLQRVAGRLDAYMEIGGGPVYLGALDLRAGQGRLELPRPDWGRLPVRAVGPPRRVRRLPLGSRVEGGT